MYLYCEDLGGEGGEQHVRKSFMGDALPVKNPEECIGEIEFELTDFLNDKIHKREFYKYFSGPLLKIPILTWGVKFSMGILPSNIGEFGEEKKFFEAANIEHISLNAIDGVYVPPMTYYTYEPLPNDWYNFFDKFENYKPVRKPKDLTLMIRNPF
jgi:hypothetical protein